MDRPNGAAFSFVAQRRKASPLLSSQRPLSCSWTVSAGLDTGATAPSTSTFITYASQAPPEAPREIASRTQPRSPLGLILVPATLGDSRTMRPSSGRPAVSSNDMRSVPVFAPRGDAPDTEPVSARFPLRSGSATANLRDIFFPPMRFFLPHSKHLCTLYERELQI